MPYYNKEHRSAPRNTDQKKNRAQQLNQSERVIPRRMVRDFVTQELKKMGAIPTDFSLQPTETAYRRDLTS